MKLINMARSIMLAAALASFSNAPAQVVVPNQTAQDLAEALAGPGVTVSNATLTCNALSNGTFTLGAAPLGITSGIVLTSGLASTAGNVATYDAHNESMGNAGDADLDGLIIQPTLDACILEFDLTAVGQAIEFRYQFGSEEYPSFTCTAFNDVFGFFINGGTEYPTKTNIALVPGTNIPVAINSINGGTPTGGGVLTNCTNMGPGSPFTAYFIDNEGSANPPVYDGLTTVLVAHADVTSGTSYHLKLGIADASDRVLTSGVFIEEGSLVVAPPTDPYAGCHCPDPDSLHKVMIGHMTGNAKKPCVNICVDTNAVSAHMAHGDIICGECPTDPQARIGNYASEGIQVMPNPNTGTFVVYLGSVEKATITVTDMMGRTIVNTETDAAAYQIDLGKNAKGFYFINVDNGVQRYRNRILVH